MSMKEFFDRKSPWISVDRFIETFDYVPAGRPFLLGSVPPKESAMALTELSHEIQILKVGRDTLIAKGSYGAGSIGYIDMLLLKPTRDIHTHPRRVTDIPGAQQLLADHGLSLTLQQVCAYVETLHVVPSENDFVFGSGGLSQIWTELGVTSYAPYTGRALKEGKMLLSMLKETYKSPEFLAIACDSNLGTNARVENVGKLLSACGISASFKPWENVFFTG